MKFTKRWLSSRAAVLALVACLGASGPVAAGEAEDPLSPLIGAEADPFDLSVEELMNIEVYSAGKKQQDLSDVAAAVYVLGQDDIRRSGATSVPELLRLVPGVEVAHIDSNKWAVTIRGFNGRFANKLLVLIDGRSVYTPTFAGVYWDVQDMLLEDIERIEVIRGPGGTLWGANAVNGVINVITKKAGETQGAFASGAVGTREEYNVGLRYGFAAADNAHVRIYAKYFDRDNFSAPAGGDGFDDWDQVRGGFRADWEIGERDSLTLQGDIYDGDSSSRVAAASLAPPDFSAGFDTTSDVSGANVIARWDRTIGDGSNLSVQAYYDRTERKSADFADDETRDTVDLEFQHRLRVFDIHDVVWGLGYRLSSDSVSNDFNASLTPTGRDLTIVNGFVQDEVSLLDERLRLTLGTKLEHNDFSGLEVQPNARVLWKISESRALWGAVSRAVRTPSRVENDGRLNRFVLPPGSLIPGSPATVIALAGSRSFDSEDLIAFELGYRAEPTETLRLDVATFYNLYSDLRTFTPRMDPLTGMPELEPEDDPPPPHLVWFFDVGNAMDADAYGVELAADWQPFERWQLKATYTFLDLDLDLGPAAEGDTVSKQAQGSSPEHRFTVHSMMELSDHLELDTILRWVDELPSQRVGDYAELDIRLAWTPLEALEISLVGRNLLQRDHAEFSSSPLVWTEATRVPRSLYGKITWRH